MLTLGVSVLGESGLGKSTLVNSLFLTDLYKDRKLLNAEGRTDTSPLHSMCKTMAQFPDTRHLMHCMSSERIIQTVQITKHTVSIEEKGVKLRLTIVDTPGFGDAVNNTERLIPFKTTQVEH